MEIVNAVITNPAFIGLWTYRSTTEQRRFCASVLHNGKIVETDLYLRWEDAIKAAKYIMDQDNETT